jgi:hypothetical protein
VNFEILESFHPRGLYLPLDAQAKQVMCTQCFGSLEIGEVREHLERCGETINGRRDEVNEKEIANNSQEEVAEGG